MSKILYRAKRKSDGQWVKGYYAKAKYYLDDQDIHVIFPTDLTLYPHSEFSSYEEIIPETLGRLLEHPCWDGYYENPIIFQNDIIAVWENRHADIEKNDPDCNALVLDESTISAHGGGRWFPQDTTRVKVIGNIYDNPELINWRNPGHFVNAIAECPDDYHERYMRIRDEYHVDGSQVACYLCNYGSDYICYRWRGGCSNIEECRGIYRRELVRNSYAGDERKD